MMTNRERILTLLDGGTPDRIPWIPRLKIWYDANRLAGTLPARYRGLSLREVEQRVFGGAAARDGVIYTTSLDNVDVRTRHLDSLETVTEYVTPVGTVTSVERGSNRLRAAGIQDAQTEFVLKRREDYAVVQYLFEHTRYEPAYEDYLRYEAEIGEAGYPMVNCGDCPFHHWMRGLAGYNAAYFHLMDYTQEVERLLTVITQRYQETIWKHMLDSPARLLMHGHHLSSQMTPPTLFEPYITPYFQELTAKLRSAGKVVALHGDNNTRHILRQIEQAGFGMVECFVTSPMVETTLQEARDCWGDRVIIWGGIPSVLLEDPYTDEQFEQYVDEVLATIADGRAFILGIADNAMPDAKIERIERITERLAG
jgi:hypothetical protein